jgi:hypothetical protein
MTDMYTKDDLDTAVANRGYWIHADTKRDALCSTISPVQDYIDHNKGVVIVSQKKEKPDINLPTKGNNRGGRYNPCSRWIQPEHTNRVEFWVTGPRRTPDLLKGLGIDLEICLTIQDTNGEIVYNRVLLTVNRASENVSMKPCGLCFAAYFTPSAEEVEVNEKYNPKSVDFSEDLSNRFVFTVLAKMYRLSENV